ncbi:hypothetical protein SKAU_G00180570 [Synaphobranchus kaupii]|uniref:Major facilitator superfamily (MFS) profile domain-containing protein n=1 Tax=Synaphobranchus kaupii TaxID=118154 RepID=A0A9Q1J1R3_SYNKA|nr:hypothetical protein SKAU_G00180570 [Synaphobranchus kaupii]
MKFEHVLAETDGFGRFQIMTISLIFVTRITLPCHYLVHNFIAAVTDHRCDISGMEDGKVFRNLTQDQRLSVSIPAEDDGSRSSCKMFREPQFHLLYNFSNATEMPAVPCQYGWVYDTSIFSSTLATEWDLVCDKRSLNKATATIFFVGVMTGAVVSGSLSDRYGRKSMLLVSYLSGMVFGLASAFSSSFLMFAIIRFFTGFGIAGINIISIVLCLEWVDIEHRKLTLSNIVVLGKGQKTYTYLDLVRTPKMRRLALLTGIIWFGIAFTFYGISFNITGFGMNIYLTQCVYATIEVPALLAVYYLLDKIGRRRFQVWALLGVGLCLAVNTFIPKDMSLYRSIVAILGKGCAAASYTTVFLYTPELYPTVVRQNGMGYNSFISRLAVSIAPLVTLLDVWEPLPQVIMCTVAITAGLVATLLPETMNKRLPETIEDVEQTRKGLVSQPVQERPNIPMEPLMNDEIEKGT